MAKVRIYSEMCKLFRYFLGKMLTFRQKNKGHRCDPTFVNLKSNTMKNTMQSYGFFCQIATFGV